MKDISQFRTCGLRALVIAAVMASGLSLATTAVATVDSSSHIVDHNDRTVEAIQSDTRIDFVPPLDGNPLSREWFHHGRASFRISGPNADDWHGKIVIGYQVGFPATLDGKLKFNYSTPGLGVEFGTDGPLATLDDLIPQLGVELEVGFGPGIETVECTSAEISGSEGFVLMSGFHGTVTGVVGPTTIRPFVAVVGASGDAVYTYGRLWTI
ncbi:MspA family porin [Nocardia brasiliensis]|uniref:MspA family porin n=1 Tax=Nocardia brasiliensis TaxID=37326 RepID=UPI002453FB58|nr:MspA family porin [Nocardia brasiliensis]